MVEVVVKIERIKTCSVQLQYIEEPVICEFHGLGVEVDDDHFAGPQINVTALVEPVDKEPFDEDDLNEMSLDGVPLGSVIVYNPIN